MSKMVCPFAVTCPCASASTRSAGHVAQSENQHAPAIYFAPLSRVVPGLNFQRGVIISPRLAICGRVPWVEKLFRKPSNLASGVGHMDLPALTSGGNCFVELQCANGSSSVAMQFSGSDNGRPPSLAATKFRMACISVLDFAPHFSQE